MPPPHRRRRVAALLVLLVVAVLWRPASAHVRAASLLQRFADPDASGWLAEVGRHPVDEQDDAIAGTAARVYLPTDVAHPPGIVLVHGVHWRGIDEPRLQRFARSIAASGVAVLTPRIDALCDYRIEPGSVDTIGEAARAWSERLDGRRVGLVGFSFAGGLSIVAASVPRYADALAFVVSIGGHDDLGRVLRFFVTGDAPRPEGAPLQLHAHDYGTVVLEYAHAEDFFPPEDVVAARDVLRSVLHEDFDAARGRAASLSPASAARMDAILAHDVGRLGSELLAEIERLRPGFDAVSPSAHLDALRVPTFVLHGAGDVLIPPSEAEWLARGIPADVLRADLVSPAIEHVDLQNAGWPDQLVLVHFMGDVLEAADASDRQK